MNITKIITPRELSAIIMIGDSVPYYVAIAILLTLILMMQSASKLHCLWIMIFIINFEQDEFAHFLHFVMKKHWKKLKKLSSRVVLKAVRTYAMNVIRFEVNTYLCSQTMQL